MADFTPAQGRYLAFIHAYIKRRGCPPAESDIAAAMCVSPPSVNQMVKMLEKKGLILRHPGQARALQILIPEDEIPSWGSGKPGKKAARSDQSPSKPKAVPKSPPANLYVVEVFLIGGPVSDKFRKKQISRMIEIRGEQKLEDLHQSIFKAYDRWEQHLYEFQFGKRPHDPDGTNYGIGDPPPIKGKKAKKQAGDARTTKLDDLDLRPDQIFGYWFDFVDHWFHQINLLRIEQAIPTVTYPRVIRRVSMSPPQYADKK
ncbi:MAG: MarR family transcriptional regulator [Planctomycetaceae bacterium]|nr:MAG: MarR family transcriptional regulator [Planctomycetaceae bacterium]